MDSNPDAKGLMRKRSDTDLMPPPPPAKKIRRPKQALSEEEYTGSLSQIIARDYFPGIEAAAVQNEYLDAVESQDVAWISNASRRLQQAMTPGRRTTPFASKQLQDNARTPTTYVGDTPSSVAQTSVEESPLMGAGMSLSKFQATYTSEDNESFYKLLDKQNQKRAEKCAWLWNNNKLPSKQMIKQKEVTDKLGKTRNLVDDGFKRYHLAIKSVDDRPARPDAWSAAPRNGLMFEPNGLEDGVVTVAQKAEESSRMAPRSIVHENTRMPPPHVPQRPPSPTMSSVRDAVAGIPRQQDQDSSVGGGETPRVNGYAFVDDEDDEPNSTRLPPTINLGPGDTHNPFKLQKQRKRESLHEQPVERIAKNNKEESCNGRRAKAEESQTRRFPGSPRVSESLTPAAQRLLSKMGTPRSEVPGSSFGLSTPRKSRAPRLRSVTRPGSIRD